MSEVYELTAGTVPVLVSVPHDGRRVPEEVARRMTAAGGRIPDTDWHVRRLCGFALGLGAAVIAATHSRYVVDLNRDPAGEALYPGADNTEIVPLTTFDGRPIYRAGAAPGADEVAERIARYWRPYHARLAAEVAEIRARHGLCVLFDAHSIRSVVPRFFEGTLPDLNFGTASGASADPDLARRAYAVLAAARGYTAVDNGRFTGGYITRHYGAPGAGVHALQLEIAQRTYMDEAYPFEFRPGRARRLRPVLRALLETCIDWAEARRRRPG